MSEEKKEFNGKKKNELLMRLKKIKEKMCNCTKNKGILCYCIIKLEKDLETVEDNELAYLEGIIGELEKQLQIPVPNISNTKEKENKLKISNPNNITLKLRNQQSEKKNRSKKER